MQKKSDQGNEASHVNQDQAGNQEIESHAENSDQDQAGNETSHAQKY